MNRRTLLLLTALAPVGAAGAAHASSPKPSAGKAEPVDPRYMVIHNLPVPATREGRLTGYLFCDIRIGLTDEGEAGGSRAKAPFMRDAMIRACHRTIIAEETSGEAQIKQSEAESALKEAAMAVLGAGAVRAVAITNPRRMRLR